MATKSSSVSPIGSSTGGTGEHATRTEFCRNVSLGGQSSCDKLGAHAIDSHKPSFPVSRYFGQSDSIDILVRSRDLSDDRNVR